MRNALRQVVAEADERAMSPDAYGEIARRAQESVRIEDVLGARDVETVDRLDAVTTLNPELAEHRVGVQVEDAQTGHFAALPVGQEARLAHGLHLAVEGL